MVSLIVRDIDFVREFNYPVESYGAKLSQCRHSPEPGVLGIGD